MTESNSMPRRCAWALLLLPFAPLTAQIEPTRENQELTASAMLSWVADFEAGRLGPRALVRNGHGLQPRYMRAARAAGLVNERDADRITHLDMLGKMLIFAEHNPTTELGEAALAVAAAGFDEAFLDRTALEVREQGHWSLMRMDHRGVWFMLLRAAAGEQVLVLSAERAVTTNDDESGGVVAGPARRVAALRLLGMKNRPVFRSTIEACLWDPDPRVRLAAAEALDFQRRPQSLSKVMERVQLERHPVVSQALVRLLRKLTQLPGELPTKLDRRRAVEVALSQFGKSGWRTDMDLLELVERHPSRAMIPLLIDALERASKEPDKLVATVNQRASMLLREKAGGLLRAMTGALIPEQDYVAWREFWAREKDRIEVPDVLKKDTGAGTQATFFGVPVTGSSIAFLIDTSGSMDEQVAGTGAAGGTSASPRRRTHTRLNAAKEQIVLAVQAMDPASRYQLLTFAADARTWTRRPVKPGRNSTRSLTELLSRLRANGGTNLFDGLVQALQLDEIGYGEQHKTEIDELFVLSDGQPTTGAVQNTDDLLALVREANKYARVRIHCVFTGTGGGADLLQRLAAENDGVFVQR